jgi:hypothetical protein
MAFNHIPTDPAARLALGKRIHDKTEWPSVRAAAEALGTYEGAVYTVQREYRNSAGIVAEAAERAREGAHKRRSGPQFPIDKTGLPADPAERTREISRRRSAARRAALKGEKPPSVVAMREGHLARIADDLDAGRIARLEAELDKSRADLDRAMGEVETLQAIVMALGTCLK